MLLPKLKQRPAGAAIWGPKQGLGTLLIWAIAEVVMAKRNKTGKGKPVQVESWFESSEGNQLFLWRCQPNRSNLLLAGNRRGYQTLAKALTGLERDGAVAELPCRKPELAPPIQWLPSPLGKRAIAPIHEIEADLRKTVHPFMGFVWYRWLRFCREDGLYEPRFVLRNDAVSVRLSADSLTELVDLLGHQTFPAFGGICIGESAKPGQRLWLSGDWLGAE